MCPSPTLPGSLGRWVSVIRGLQVDSRTVQFSSQFRDKPKGNRAWQFVSPDSTRKPLEEERLGGLLVTMDNIQRTSRKLQRLRVEGSTIITAELL